jgi:hypothetical protein
LTFQLKDVQFGKLRVISFSHQDVQGNFVWNCQCDCPAKTIVSASTVNLNRGSVTSCKCHRREALAAANTTHGMSGTLLHQKWESMLKRVRDESGKDSKHYRDQNVTVCERWQGPNGFQNFKDDVPSMPSAEHTLERIKVTGNYEPGNVTWATNTEQQRNKRNNLNIAINGVTHCASEWDEIKGHTPGTVKNRHHLGWSDEDAVNVPLGARRGPRSGWQKKLSA